MNPISKSLNESSRKPDNGATPEPGTGSPVPAAAPLDERRDPATQLEIASYIEEMSVELAEMARRANLSSLAYFIEMVQFEASSLRRSATTGRVEKHAAETLKRG